LFQEEEIITGISDQQQQPMAQMEQPIKSRR
jgi:hypothetical protein